MHGLRAMVTGSIVAIDYSCLTLFVMGTPSMLCRHSAFNSKWQHICLHIWLITLCGTGIGCNIPCDLHNEHVNKLIKEIVGNMGSNLTEEATAILGQITLLV